MGHHPLNPHANTFIDMEPCVQGLHQKQQDGDSPSSNLGKEKGKEVVAVEKVNYQHHQKQQDGNSPSSNLGKEKGKELAAVEKVRYQHRQQAEESLDMRRPRIWEVLGLEASELKRKNLLLQMETLDRKKLQPGKGKSCNSSDGKQEVAVGRDENKGTEDGQGGGLLEELQRFDPKKLRRVHNRRIYNQRYRLKQQMKRLELEDTHKRLMKNMKALAGLILHYNDHMARLKNENNQLRKKIADLTVYYYNNAAQIEMKMQEVTQLRELYNVQQQVILKQQQQGQQFHQNQLMPPQPSQPFPHNHYVLASIFF